MANESVIHLVRCGHEHSGRSANGRSANGILAAAVLVNGQPAFVSIDCGFSGDHAYNDLDTNLTYQPDGEFIDTGSNHELGETYVTDKPTQAHNLRSFPDGTRNCYTIKNVIRGYKYLIRASFLYGNYDNDNSLTDNGQLTFDLYLGVSLWKTMRIIDADQLYIAEIITLASSDYFFICLLRTGNGIPFISALELRPIDNGIYHDVNQTVSLLLWERWDMGSDQTFRYPKDKYDRKWMPDGIGRSCSANLYRCNSNSEPNPNVVATTELVRFDANDPYAVPSVVMQTAKVAPDNITLEIDFRDGNSTSPPPLFYIYLHFSELNASASASRVFLIKIPGIKSIPYTMTSEYLSERHVPISYQADPDPSTYYLTLTKMQGSMLPPLINAMEVYSKINLASIATDERDVYAMMAITKQYDNKHNWQGDPCVPANLSWSIVNCTSSSSTSFRVTSLNLSYKGLEDSLSTAIANLTALKILDLSNNYLRTFPDFLANLSSLQSLDLSSNKLDGPMPADLCHKQAKGLLSLRLEGNPCSSGGACECSKHTNRTQVLVVSMAATVVVVLILLSVFFIWRRRRGKRQPSKPQQKWKQIGGSSFHTDNSRFTYQDLRMITNNFERAIGKGGFGTVYYGRLPDGTEVAVKMQKRLLAIDEGVTEELKNDELSSYSHAIKEFQVEAQLLSRVHHRNLVSLIGYCNEGYSLGLVFEYAAQGSLRDHLSEKAYSEKNLSWRERLRIAIDAAQAGLEYLHKSCKPPIIHRDVKTSNILLSENFEAKIADFGLSKSFLSDAQTHISTHAIAGTPGYVDPEYHNTFRFNEKSDVYGFGIVLLELVTGLPAVLKFPETGHILQWVRQGLARGNVADIVDLRLKRQYDIYSVKKIIDLALHCTSMDANERPTMTVVSMLLKESLQLELARGEPEPSMSSYTEILDDSQSGTSEITSSAPEMSGPSTR
ncbi:probable LRR receptor-like serine/threonine-protein kinase At1g05700 isoform X1 [Zingiber officinale]|uniref:probable LRR receptor-like serine/threonine-protein kinase At1g05700 isoform X1 n=2 Tax=Zingiber officinale TaxID=94328 RepID=UPI001C4B7FD2|nr:probable LRR receptor-like serine/threonine-protein kinase At1g05700 isoform X1 [Zingiber officinale]